MKKLKTITHLSILITTPSLFAYPQNHMPHVVPQKVNWLGDWWWGSQEQAAEWVRPTTYDEIMQISDGSLKIYSPNGRGVSYKKDGSFKGFVEWQYE